jgi:hypothetical protein
MFLESRIGLQDQTPQCVNQSTLFAIEIVQEVFNGFVFLHMFIIAESAAQGA